MPCRLPLRPVARASASIASSEFAPAVSSGVTRPLGAAPTSAFSCGSRDSASSVSAVLASGPGCPLPPHRVCSLASHCAFRVATQFAPAAILLRTAAPLCTVFRIVRAPLDSPQRRVPSSLDARCSRIASPADRPTSSGVRLPAALIARRATGIPFECGEYASEFVLYWNPGQQAHSCASSQQTSAASSPHRLHGRSARRQLLPKPARPP